MSHHDDLVQFRNETQNPLLRKGAKEVLNRPQSELHRLVAILGDCAYFDTPEGVLHINMPLDTPGPRVLPLRSPRLRQWLQQDFHTRFGAQPKHHNLLRAINEIESRARYAQPAPVFPAYHRVLFHGLPVGPVLDIQSITIDLDNRSRQALEITRTSVNFIDGDEFHWRRPAGTLGLPDPKHAPEPEPLLARLRRRLRPASDTDWHRILIWLHSTLCPNGPKPVLVLDGPEQESFQAARILRDLTDPRDRVENDFPNNDSQIRRAAEENHVLVFPALQRISPKRAQTLCRLANRLRRSIILTLQRARPDRPAIADPNLAPFCLTARIQPLDIDADPEAALSEVDFWSAVSDDIPQLLGYLYAATHYSLANFEQLPLPAIPGFRDLARWCLAAAPTLPLTEELVKNAFLQPIENPPTSPNSQIPSTPPPPAPTAAPPPPSAPQNAPSPPRARAAAAGPAGSPPPHLQNPRSSAAQNPSPPLASNPANAGPAGSPPPHAPRIRAYSCSNVPDPADFTAL